MIPKSYKQITVKQYQDIYPDIKILLTSDNTDLKAVAWVSIISYLSGKSKDYVESLEISKVKALTKQLSFLVTNDYQLVKKYTWINGSLYRALNEAEKLNTAQYVSIKTFLQSGDMIEQLHNLAACSYKKLTWKGWVYDGKDHVKLAESFKAKSCHDVLPIVFFCSKVFRHWMENTGVYLKSMEILKEHIKEMQEANFISTGDGMQLLMKLQKGNLG